MVNTFDVNGTVLMLILIHVFSTSLNAFRFAHVIHYCVDRNLHIYRRTTSSEQISSIVIFLQNMILRYVFLWQTVYNIPIKDVLFVYLHVCLNVVFLVVETSDRIKMVVLRVFVFSAWRIVETQKSYRGCQVRDSC